MPRKFFLSLLLSSFTASLTFCFSGAAQNSSTQTSLTLTADQLEQVSGEYTYTPDPDTPLSFYAKDGKLYIESERLVPTALLARSPTEFSLPRSHVSYRFNPSEKEVAINTDTVLRRTGEAVHHVFHSYERREEMIPMRDGVKLHAVILTPTDISGPLPILMERTPYGVDELSERSFFEGRPNLARAGYILVAEDIRGRFKSEGEFVMMRPLADHKNRKAVDESTDAYDTVGWLLKNLPNNNGRVGVIGTSYPGFLAMMAGIDPNPAIKAISPQAPMIDTWMGDDFFHNGAFRQTYGYDYAVGLESSKELTEVDYGKDADGKPRDGYDFFLERGSFAADVKQSGVKKDLPTWQAFEKHPTYDSFWRSRAVEYHMDKVAVPTLTVGGYYDQEDMWGPQKEYASLEPHDTDHQNFLVLGPWRHGSWSSSSRHLGALQYGESIGNEYRAQIEAKFFAKYLKDEPGFDIEDTASFQTGSNTWKRYAHFPPAEAKSTAFSLCGTGEIAAGSTCAPGKMSYVSDPANPVPYRHRPIQPTYSEGSKWGTWMVEDQRLATDRKDVAVWKLPVLDHDLTITGEVIADIFASTTGSDGDFVAKLIDQYPNDDPDPAMRGFQLMTNMEIFRGRYGKSFEKPEALKPGEVNEFKWSLHDVDHVFRKGHTVLVEIQSTWFPLYDRNPQTFVPNIMLAKPEDYKPATITIFTDEKHDSKLILPVVH
ncbi:CocE/NonD family hydrolase [Acidicapsa acidisoli]|uniref:CocE/NonD family hydrolase n=1 Tax=Acidicapsa acidisoli TaxID=1615681 RepID=UPI0021E05F28|nr:CocE/NonD family hydrolase [Acidicapsa acidisoli]